MKLQIGIDQLKPGWQIILQQEGYSCTKVDFSQKIKISDFVCLIITQQVENYLLGNLQQYLTEGGILITTTHSAKQFLNAETKRRYVKSLQVSPSSIFSDLGMIDFFSQFEYFDAQQFTWLDDKLLIQYQEIEQGLIINLPFDPNELIINKDNLRKKFWAERQELPSEIVAKNSKGKIRQIIHKVILWAHHRRDQPLIRILEFPAYCANLFLFRVDTDFCTSDEAKKLLELCRKYKITGSWFVDTKSQEALKNIYAKMPDQEIGLHCSQHLVFKDSKSNRKNIENGLRELENHKIKVRGFAAPFGDWNECLAQILEEKKFAYSSEFVLNYDDLPFYPFVDGKRSSVLQIPIHPISSGRLRRSHFNEMEMWQYFKNYIDRCHQHGEPIIIYHHPSHGHLKVIEKIFAYINKLQIPNISFLEYCEFWKKRSEFEFKAEITDKKIQCQQVNSSFQFCLEYIDKTAVISLQPETDLNQLAWKMKKKTTIPTDLKRLRRWHWRDVLYNYESKKGKKIHENISG